ncbi:MAG: mechanosensitive ion channel [Atopobiaceae bacterium]|nr:mechanosensitive ion channel [Atopobiaceae bacterium]
MELLQQLLPDIDRASLVGKALLLCVVVLVTMIVQRLSVRFVKRVLERYEVPSASIFINLLRGFIWSFALLFVLHPVFGIEPTAFVAALGVSSVALSFGLQDTISNLIGGLSLMLSRVIVPGDVVTVGGFTGTVRDINWRVTELEARGHNVEVIPNSVLLKSSFTKLTPGAAAACSITFVVRSDVDPAIVEAEVIEATKVLGDLADPERRPVIKFGAMDAYGTTVTLVSFLKPEAQLMDANDLIIRQLMGKPWLARVV